jgi:hypothetical protein
VFEGESDPRSLESAGERACGPGNRVWIAAERAMLNRNEAGRSARNIRHRRKIDVHTGGSEQAARRKSLIAGNCWLVHLFGRHLRRPGEPPDFATLLIGHDQQGGIVPLPSVVLKLLDRASHLRRGQIAAEQDHTADVPLSDPREQLR